MRYCDQSFGKISWICIWKGRFSLGKGTEKGIKTASGTEKFRRNGEKTLR